jgi:hypothetical protein
MFRQLSFQCWQEREVRRAVVSSVTVFLACPGYVRTRPEGNGPNKLQKFFRLAPTLVTDVTASTTSLNENGKCICVSAHPINHP